MHITAVFSVLILSVLCECNALGPVGASWGSYIEWGKLFRPDRQIEKVKVFEGPPIRCEVLGSRPEPEITWAIGSRILAKNQYSVYTSEEDSLKVISELKVALSDREKLEWISCVAENPEFPNLYVSGMIRLTVTTPRPGISTTTTTTTTQATPVIKSAPDSKVDKVEIVAGPPIRCVASGSRPQPNITWKIDNEEIPKEKYTYNYEKVSLNATSDLSIELSRQGKSVKLTCIAKNPKFPESSSWGSINVTIPVNSSPDNPEVKQEGAAPGPGRGRGPNVISDVGAVAAIGTVAVGGAVALVAAGTVLGTVGIATADAGLRSLPGSNRKPTKSSIKQVEANVNPEVSVGNTDQKNLVTNQTIADIIKNINEKFELMNITVAELRQHLNNGMKYQAEFEQKYKEPANALYDYVNRFQRMPHGPTMKLQHSNIINLLLQSCQEMVYAVGNTHLFRLVLIDFQKGANTSIDPASEFRGKINELGKNAKGVTLEIFKEINEISSLSDFYTKKITECLKPGIVEYSLSSENMNRKVINGFRELKATYKILDENRDNAEKWSEEYENLKKSIKESQELIDMGQRFLTVRKQSLSCTANLAKSMQDKIRELLPKTQACFIL